MDKTGTPAAPAATTPAPAAPAADPVKTTTMAAILGLVKPEEADVRPPPPQRSVTGPAADDDDVQPAKQPVVERLRKPAETTPPAATETKPTETPAAPAATAATIEPPKPATVLPKKVEVKRKPKTSIADEVKKAVQEVLPAAPVTPAPAPVAATPAAPVAPTAPDIELLPDELEELELARYAEQKDPARKGLGEKFIDFYKKQKAYLETAAAKAEADGEEYDPTKDPEFKKFLAKNQPNFTRADRKKFEADRIYDKAKGDAAREAEAKLKPELAELRRKTLELEHRPVINKRVTEFAAEVIDAMPEDVVKFYKENNRDVEKTRAAFPLEFEAVATTANGARALAEEFLAVKAGLRDFQPDKDPKHEFLGNFVEEQANDFEKNGRDFHVRNGKTFVHPSKWRPGMAAKHWTFDNEDVLLMLKVRANQEARAKIKAEQDRIARLGFVRPAAAPAAPSGASTPAAAPAEPQASPRTPTTPLPGAAPAKPAATGGALASVLGLK